MKARLVIVALLLVGILVTSCGPKATPTPSAAATLDKIIEEAKKEGKLVVYSSYNVAQGEKIHKKFMEKYPFITVEHVSVGGPDVASRIALEVGAGTAGADIGLTGVNFIQAVVDEGQIQKVDWASMGVGKDVIASDYLLRIANISFTLCWNTNLVPNGLTGWEDLADPQWKGKIGQWVNGEPFAYLVPAWGEAKVDSFLGKLLDNKPVLNTGLTTMMDQLAAGEIAACISNESNLLGYKAKGAPIDGIWAEPVPVIDYDAAIPTNAAHPNAAKLYAAWLVSAEGAAVYEEAVSRGNIFVPTTKIAQILKGKKLSTFTPDKMVQAGDLVKKYKAMIEAKK